MEPMLDLGIAALWHALTNAAQKPIPISKREGGTRDAVD